jgi:hypothetical protein
VSGGSSSGSAEPAAPDPDDYDADPDELLRAGSPDPYGSHPDPDDVLPDPLYQATNLLLLGVQPPGPLMSEPAEEAIVTCPGCGGKNPSGSNECDWCGRPFVTRGGRLRLTAWHIGSSLLVLVVIGAVAWLAFLNAGRALPPVRASAATSTPVSTSNPTPAVTPRVTVANAPTATPAPVAAESGGATPAPTSAEAPTPEPTAPPELQAARIANTSGLGVSVRLEPGQNAQRAGVLREGTRVLLTGNDQTVAARPWREIETEDHNLKGWVQGDFIQLLQATP